MRAEALEITRGKREILQGCADRFECNPALGRNESAPGNDLRERGAPRGRDCVLSCSRDQLSCLLEGMGRISYNFV